MKGKLSKGRFVLAVFSILMLLIATACSQTSTAPANNQNGANSGAQSASNESKVIKVGIVQIIEHPALDAARDGFIAKMKANGFEKNKTVVYDLQSAQGNMDTAIQIAKKFTGDKVDLILAIGTPAVQAVAQTTTDIPILFTAVTDPVSAGLVKSMDKPGGNVSGTTDMNPVEEQLSLIKKVKADAKNVGVIYNSGEVNSKVQVDKAKEVAKKFGLTIIEAAITNPTEVKQAAESMVGKVDSFYVPTDNMVVASISAVVSVAEAQKIPVVAGEENSVKSGAITTFGIDYSLLGAQTGDMATKILKGESKVGDMPVESQKEMKLVINKKAAEKMGISLPQDLIDKAVQTFDQ
ncbi:ABC transporter substrate-binding protein [Brevibacillus laterosporus]|nr:ABC transporter substrate-binding protein [Brevibacillus laterosporus]MCR8985033.1 ABC transporter substrate-binding protein [Brevibacillus laterosporus]MCZ0830762.1 ABC transporter substrate-binding protein [Brevibacillus halotolerans]